MSNILLRFLIIFVFFIASENIICSNTDKLDKLKEQIDTKDLSTIVALEKEAIKQSDHLYLAFAYYSKSSYYQINYSEDSIAHYIHLGFNELNLLKNEFNKFSKSQTELYQFLKIKFTNSIVHKYLSDNKYDLALIYIDRILKEGDLGAFPIFEYEAYYLLGVCYLHVKKGKEALESFRKAYSLYDNNTDKKPFSYHNPFRGMAHAFILLKDYDSVIVINDSVKRKIEEDYTTSKSNTFFYYLSKYVINNEKALAYVKKGELENARKILDESKKIYSEHLKDSPLIHAYYEVEAQYYSAKKDHNKAKMYINHTLDSVHSKVIYKNSYNYIIGNLIKADILHEAGDNSEAYDLLRDLYQLNDSISAESFSNQIAEIQTLYNVDKLKLESERDKIKLRSMQNALFGFCLVLLLFIYIIYVSRRNARILKKKNKQLVNQFSVIEKGNKQIQDLQLQKIKESKEDISDTSSSQKLVEKLELYLKESQVYCNHDLTREELALEMGTNRQYLIEAIKEQTGKTYNEYIYSFRLKYAYDLIVNDKTKPISEVYLEAGFLTKGTFNRAFKDTFGMTPTELKNAVD